MKKRHITTNLLIGSLLASNASSIYAVTNDNCNKEISIDSQQNTSNVDIQDEIIDTDVLPDEDTKNEVVDTEVSPEEKPDEDTKNEVVDTEVSPEEKPEEDTKNEVVDTEVSPEEKPDDIVEDDKTDDTDNNAFVDIKNNNLLVAINTYLKKEDLNKPISKIDALSIIELDISNSKIEDLSGIENFKNLEVLNISCNNIKDINVLSKLKKLKNLNATGNSISNINPLKELVLDKCDLSNQLIKLPSKTILEKSFTLKNPVSSFFDLVKEDFKISNNGLFSDNFIYWDNLSSGKFDLNVNINRCENNINYSALIIQPIDCKYIEDDKDSNNSDTKIDLDIKFKKSISTWTNSDITIEYDISGKSVDLIKQIEFSKENFGKKKKGNLKVSKNGEYNLNIFLENGSVIKKMVKVDNIDKEKPIITLLEKNIVNNKASLKIGTKDFLSGVDYILLPNGKKVYDLKFTHDILLGEAVCFKVFDKAGNYSELNIDLKNEKTRLPIINASNKVISLGSKFNPLENVSAKDFKGKDITNKIIVLKNEVDSKSLGEYLVTYSVTDSYGNTSGKTIKVEVVDNKNDLENDTHKNDTSNLVDTQLENEIKKEDDGISKDTYVSAIFASILAGFTFLFKSGKDNF